MNMLTQFDTFAQTHTGSGLSLEARQKALAYVAEHGLPTRKQEDWKYTSVKPLTEEIFAPATATAGVLSAKNRELILTKLYPGFINLVFHNGLLNSELSADINGETGLKLGSASTVNAQAIFTDAFEALNTAYQNYHYQLDVRAEVSVKKPIHLVFVTTLNNSEPVMIHPRITINVGTGSSVKVLESYYGEQDARYFVNPTVTVNAGASSKVVFARLQADSAAAINIGRTTYNLAPFASLHSLAFSTGAALSRHNLHMVLKSEGATAILDGVYLVKRQQHVDNATLIDHQVGGCNTSQHYKGIIADRARAVFNGKVVIGKGAQKANSQQLNNNLLLSRTAEADSKPQLEVYADDVKASHGSTVGQLNREELFYLESRAIPPAVAIPMLSFGYASELIYKIEDESLQQWLNEQLKQAFAGLTIEAS